jgi:site-specific DNA-methyltransferase (adenine-specific)
VFSGTDRLTSGGFKRITPKPVNEKKCRGTIWPYATSNTEGNRTKLKHPATFPDRLAADLIECFSRPGDLVLDPMAGSATTCVAAGRLGRDFVGVEINHDYVEIARHRLETELPTLAKDFAR